MSDIAIHQLPAAGALSGTEILPIDDGSATLHTTIAAVRQGLAPLGHGHSAADVDGLPAALNAKAPLESPVFTGTVKVVAGTASTPALGPAQDYDTGLFFPAADAMAVSAGGVERLRILGDGTFQIRNGGDTYLGIVPVVPHQAANVSSIGLAVVDGGPPSGVFVHNTHDGTYSSQMIRLTTGQGGVTVATERVRVAANGTITLGGAPGAEGLRVVPAAGANRSVTVTGSQGGDPTIATSGGRLAFGAIPVLPSYTVATLPSAAARGLIYVSDGGGNKRLAISDGLAWRWPDGSAVS